MYNGNPSLRKDGEYIDYTPEMLEEIIKCSVDPIYFAEKYFTINTIDRGKEIISLFDYQKKMIKAYVDPPNNKRHIIVNIPRQQGKCFSSLSTIKVRNRKTGEIKELTVEEFFNNCKQK